MTKDFDIADILSVITGCLLSPSMTNVYVILNYLTDDNLFTHQLPRARDFAVPVLAVKFPDLAAVEIPSFSGTAEERKDACERFLNGLRVKHGDQRALEPIGGWTYVDPLTELACLMNKSANSN